MSSSKSGRSQAAARYAKALFELAREGALEAVEKDLVALKELVESHSDVQSLIHTPLVSREAKEKALVEILEKAGAQEMVIRFVATLARNNRLPLIGGIIEAFLAKAMEYRKEVVAEITTATVLQGESLAFVVKALEETLGKKVKAKVAVDKNILGGLVVKVGSVMLDNSLKSKLDRLEQLGEAAALPQAA